MTKRSIGPAGASIVSDDGTKIKLTGQQKKLIEKALKRMGDDAGTFMTTITEVVGKKGVGPAGQRVSEMNKDKNNTWIIDPIDGTINFSHGIPHFAISIALKITSLSRPFSVDTESTTSKISLLCIISFLH